VARMPRRYEAARYARTGGWPRSRSPRASHAAATLARSRRRECMDASFRKIKNELGTPKYSAHRREKATLRFASTPRAHGHVPRRRAREMPRETGSTPPPRTSGMSGAGAYPIRRWGPAPSQEPSRGSRPDCELGAWWASCVEGLFAAGEAYGCDSALTLSPLTGGLETPLGRCLWCPFCEGKGEFILERLALGA